MVNVPDGPNSDMRLVSFKHLWVPALLSGGGARHNRYWSLEKVMVVGKGSSNKGTGYIYAFVTNYSEQLIH